MFMYNMYLQIRNLSDRNARRPNVLLLTSSTLLFVMITSVSWISFGGTVSGTVSHVFAIPAMGYRGGSDL